MEYSFMAQLYADRVIKRKKLFSEVPKMYKEEVRHILVEKGREDLIDEE